MNKTYELFHRIGDGASANIRRLIVESGLSEKIRFRNVGTSDEAMTALRRVVATATVPTVVVYNAGACERILTGEQVIRDFVRELTA